MGIAVFQLIFATHNCYFVLHTNKYCCNGRMVCESNVRTSLTPMTFDFHHHNHGIVDGGCIHPPFQPHHDHGHAPIHHDVFQHQSNAPVHYHSHAPIHHNVSQHHSHAPVHHDVSQHHNQSHAAIHHDVSHHHNQSHAAVHHDVSQHLNHSHAPVHPPGIYDNYHRPPIHPPNDPVDPTLVYIPIFPNPPGHPPIHLPGFPPDDIQPMMVHAFHGELHGNGGSHEGVGVGGCVQSPSGHQGCVDVHVGGGSQPTVGGSYTHDFGNGGSVTGSVTHGPNGHSSGTVTGTIRF